MSDRSAGKASALRQTVGHGLRRLGAAALDWLYPPRCLACEEEAAESGGLCAACWRDAPFLGDDVCPRCGSPAGAGLDAATRAALARLGADTAFCVDCPRRETAWTRVRAAARYEGVARDLVLALKEGDRIDVAPMMARRMARAGQELAGPGLAGQGNAGQGGAGQGGAGQGLASRPGGPPVLVPVPLHWRRRLSRRFNQSATLARAIARETGWPLALGVLRRPRAMGRQTRLAGEERRRGAEGAFRAPAGPPLQGRAVLLVDDVMTTGATLDAAARALLDAGAIRVDGLVFARSSLADPVLGAAGREHGRERGRDPGEPEA